MKTKLLVVFAFLAFQSTFADPIAPALQPIQYCDPNNDGFGVFDLDSLTPIIIAAQSGSASDFVVTYHETADDAQSGDMPVGSPYNNIDPWSQIMSYRVRQISTNTFATGVVKLNVNPRPEAQSPPDLTMCDYNNNGVETFDFNQLVPQILGSINPATNTVTFHASLSSANAGIAPITSPYSGTNGQTIYVRVTTNATGCYHVMNFQLHLVAIPSSMQPSYPEYVLCDSNDPIGVETFDLNSRISSILMGQTGVSVTFFPTLGDAQNGTHQIFNLQYANEVQYVQTLGIRLTNNIMGCYTISTMDIRVNPLPNLIPQIIPYTVCDDNQDGFASFDLDSLVADLTQGSAMNVTFHETFMEAQIGLNPLSSLYYNINPFVQVIYVRGSDPISGCYSVMQIELYVNPAPIVASVNSIEMCDNDINPQNGTSLINLTVQTADILSQQPLPPSSYVVTYYISQANAEAALSPIIPATNYFAADGEMIWFRVETTLTGCYAVGSFNIVINSPLPLTTPTPLQVCDSDANPNDQFAVFDLTIKDPEITQGSVSAFVTYYPSLLHAQNGTNAISNPTTYINTIPAVQTLGVSVTSSSGCISITTLDIRVVPVPTPNTNPPALAPQCDVNNTGDMMEVFDLTVNEAYIRNDDPNLTFRYFNTMSDAFFGANEHTTPTAALVGGNVWIRVENNYVGIFGDHCYALVEQPLTVYAMPTVVQPLPPYRICDSDADGMAQFDLNNPSLATMILGPNQLTANFTITYHLTAANAASGISPLPSTYTNVTPNSQNVYIRVVNNIAGCVNATGILTLAVERSATATGPQFFADCDNYGDPYDGIHRINLTQFASSILNGQNPAVFLLSYYTSQSDAIADVNALTQAQVSSYMTNPDVDTVWVKVKNTNNGIQPFCYALTTINIRVDRYPNPIIYTADNRNAICVDYATNNVIQPLTLNSGIANSSAYTFEWYEMGSPSTVIGTSSTYSVNTPAVGGATRTYIVKVRANGTLGCQRISASYSVMQSGPAMIPAPTVGYIVTNLSGVQSITVTIVGYGTYQYSLDNGPHQTSNVFNNVSLGTHTVNVWDMEGNCDPLIIGSIGIVESVIPAPIGLGSQTFAPGATLAEIVVNGSNIQWYATANNKNNLTVFSTPLPLSTVLVDGTTYYATQTVGGIESEAYLPVTVHITLGVDDNEILPIQYAPNPVKNNLTIKSKVALKSVTVYTLLGQKVFEQDYNDTDINIDLSNLTAGNYILKAQGETGQKTIRIIKQ